MNELGETCHVVDALIGEGAGGRVYRARHRLQTTAPPYAVKVFKAHHERRIPPEVARECEASKERLSKAFHKIVQCLSFSFIFSSFPLRSFKRI